MLDDAVVEGQVFWTGQSHSVFSFCVNMLKVLLQLLFKNPFIRKQETEFLLRDSANGLKDSKLFFSDKKKICVLQNLYEILSYFG